MNKRIWLLLATTALFGCDLAPDFKMPDDQAPTAFKEESKSEIVDKSKWLELKPLSDDDRGNWWSIFGDSALNDLQKQALDANQTLKIAAARVLESRAIADANSSSLLPFFSIGGNASRSKSSDASLEAFGSPKGTKAKAHTLYLGQGVLDYELDLFGSVRNQSKAASQDARAQEANYRNVLLALQADVASQYYLIRSLDSQRKLLRETVAIRAEAARIMGRRHDEGDVGEQDYTRTQSELSTAQAELTSLERSRANAEHALAVLLGKAPSEFTMPESPLADAMPPKIPGGLPSELLARRPDIAAAANAMAAANARIGVARAAFFPKIDLTASGGFESAGLGSLFQTSSRYWALGQTGGAAITMPIFDAGRIWAGLKGSNASYDESVASYRSQVLVAFRDVEDNLSDQRYYAEQSSQLDAAADASTRTSNLTRKRYDQGDTDYFEVAEAERVSLAAQQAALQIRGQRFLATVALVRALGGGWNVAKAEPAKEENKAPEEKSAD